MYGDGALESTRAVGRAATRDGEEPTSDWKTAAPTKVGVEGCKASSSAWRKLKTDRQEGNERPSPEVPSDHVNF
uniref:Uncharacterized protein n=1 Tax=Trichuris muris TaxID=70415 RepID=A0A5S6QCJ1_TRIMR